VFRCLKKEANSIRRPLAILGAVILCFCAVAIGNVLYVRHQATTLISELASLDSVSDPSGVALALVDKYSNHRVDKICESDLCQYQFLFTNDALSRLHLAPRAEIRAYMTLRHSALAIIVVDYTSSVFKANSPIVGIQEDLCKVGGTPPCDYFFLNPHGLNVAETWNGSVTFGQMATAVQKQTSWAMNPNCFIAWGGCKNISELLPQIWKLTSPGAVSSRMRSMADSIADASQPLPQ
jgi:hypothetical protein